MPSHDCTSVNQALIASHMGSSNHTKHCKGNDTQILQAKPIMIDQTEQLQKELHLVRTQREAANRDHRERVRKSRQQQQALHAEIHRLLRRGVMPHEARAALLESGTN
jgi:lipid A disaccharide synthetase